MAGFNTLFEMSRDQKKGIMVYFDGQSLGGVVTAINTNSIEMKNQEFEKIVLLLDSITAVAIS